VTNIDTHISAAHVADAPRIALRDAAKASIDGFARLTDMLLDWMERARQRRELLSLGDRALQDFGASRADAAAEGDKRFWRA
jgi:uncharacterized protein YjiS (DUF1127 family)